LEGTLFTTPDGAAEGAAGEDFFFTTMTLRRSPCSEPVLTVPSAISLLTFSVGELGARLINSAFGFLVLSFSSAIIFLCLHLYIVIFILKAQSYPAVGTACHLYCNSSAAIGTYIFLGRGVLLFLLCRDDFFPFFGGALIDGLFLLDNFDMFFDDAL
jgi:hypothetical protein